jgi:hypothetical protein
MSQEQNKLETVREDLMACFREKVITRQVSANLSLAMVWLHLITEKIELTPNPMERRRLATEFEKGIATLETTLRCFAPTKSTPLNLHS